MQQVAQNGEKCITGIFKKELKLNEVGGRALIHSNRRPFKEIRAQHAEWWTREDKEETAVYMPRREASGGQCCHTGSLIKEAISVA